MSHFLFLLGRNAVLSRAELQGLCDEILYDANTSLLLAENIPEGDPQSFLDRLGGTVRMARVIDEYESESAVLEALASQANEQKPEGKIHLGISIFGMGEKRLRYFCPTVKTLLKEKFGRSTRTVNRPGLNLESGQMFGSKLLSKGFEFIIWRRGSSFLLAQTVANQDIRSYTIRDREKPFRDAKMGMLPPKLAQILVNLGVSQGKDPHSSRQDVNGSCPPSVPLRRDSSPCKGGSEAEIIIDPFCGSGTISIEAALMGYETEGSDLSMTFAQGARQNFSDLARRLGFAPESGKFQTSDALKLPWEKMSGIVVTEGMLGTNFASAPTPPQIRENAVFVLTLWEKLFQKIATGNIPVVCCCLPCWRQGSGSVSIAGKLMDYVRSLGYTPDPVFGGKKSSVYARESAFVGREVVVFRKSK